jgi:hypothetical protein
MVNMLAEIRTGFLSNKILTLWAKWIMYVRYIHGMCTNMDQYMWMIQEYGEVAAIQILLRSSLFDCRPGHRLSWLMFLVKARSSFRRMKGQYFNQTTTASSQSLFRLSYIQYATRRHKI